MGQSTPAHVPVVGKNYSQLKTMDDETVVIICNDLFWSSHFFKTDPEVALRMCTDSRMIAGYFSMSECGTKEDYYSNKASDAQDCVTEILKIVGDTLSCIINYDDRNWYLQTVPKDCYFTIVGTMDNGEHLRIFNPRDTSGWMCT